MSTEDSSPSISTAETARYDRQIRVWGLAAQKRMREAKVCIVGARGLAAEVAKTVCLAGVRSVTLVDTAEPVRPCDVGANFFLRTTDADSGHSRVQCMTQRLQTLNPNVAVNFLEKASLALTADEVASYSVVVVTEPMQCSLVELDQFCRTKDVSFFVAIRGGLWGFYFVDLGSEYNYERVDRSNNTTTFVPTTTSYCSLADLVQLKRSQYEKSFRRRQKSRIPMTQEAIELLAQRKTAEAYETGVTNSVLGALLGQDVLRAVSRVGRVVRNLLTWDGRDECECRGAALEKNIAPSVN
ncbi:MAG: hypothetical protein MHM6MM_004920 [Cercozoa sp. M6MM]